MFDRCDAIKLIPAMVSIIGNGLHPCVLGSRILGGYALKGGMPPWKYVSNRFLTAAENLLLGAKLSLFLLNVTSSNSWCPIITHCHVCVP